MDASMIGHEVRGKGASRILLSFDLSHLVVGQNQRSLSGYDSHSTVLFKMVYRAFRSLQTLRAQR